MTLNKATIIGRLGQDPELRYTQAGMAMANLSVATSEKRTGKDGQQQEKTEWHRVQTFGKLAELCAKYLQKGRQVYVEGRIQTRDWQDKDGHKRYTTEIVAQTVKFLDSGGQGYQSSSQSEPSNEPSNNYDQSFNDDDIPF